MGTGCDGGYVQTSDRRIPVQALLDWGAKNFRAFPWREPGIPEWHLFVAEVLLKREVGERAVAVWKELVLRYPDPATLLRARREVLVRILKPLGLQNQRADALLGVAKAVVHRFGGKLPPYADLLELPWVGPYTAGAIEIFARGGRVPLLDPNLLRVGSRYFGVPGDTARGKLQIAQTLLHNAPLGLEAAYYYAILDLGAMVCKKRPRCASCPLGTHCAFAGNTTHDIERKGNQAC
jgi:A/G-specific adenine glycosylase